MYFAKVWAQIQNKDSQICGCRNRSSQKYVPVRLGVLHLLNVVYVQKCFDVEGFSVSFSPRI